MTKAKMIGITLVFVLHHVTLLLQDFRSISLDIHLHQILLARMKIRAYGSEALQY